MLAWLVGCFSVFALRFYYTIHPLLPPRLKGQTHTEKHGYLCHQIGREDVERRARKEKDEEVRACFLVIP